MVLAGFNVTLVGPSALEHCVSDGDIATSGFLLDIGVDINAYGAGGQTPLQAAAFHGHLAIVQYLLDRGADVNLPPSDQVGVTVTALQAAALSGNGEVVDCLLEAGADVGAPPAEWAGFTVLEAAAYALGRGYKGGRRKNAVEERIATFGKLISRGASVNRTDGTGCSVLHHLATTSQIQCLKDALDAGAGTDNYGYLDLRGYPFRYKNLYVCDYLSDYGCFNNYGCRKDDSSLPMTPIQVAAACHDMDVMRLLFDRGARINAPASNRHRGRTALQAAVDMQVPRRDITCETEEVVKFLLRNDADVNAPAANNHGRTALQAATSHYESNTRVVVLLLQHGAVVNAPPAEVGGITALQGAAITGDVQIARILLAQGADINAPAARQEGRTAIEGAAEHGRMDMVRLLLDMSVTPEANDGFSRAIKFAKAEENFEIADLLRERQKVYDSSSVALVDQPAWNSGLFSLELDMISNGDDGNIL